MLKALDSYHLFIKGIKVVPEVPSSETNAFGEKSIFSRGGADRIPGGGG